MGCLTGSAVKVRGLAPSCISEQETWGNSWLCQTHEKLYPAVPSFLCPAWGSIHPWKSVCLLSITCLHAQLHHLLPPQSPLPPATEQLPLLGHPL